MNTTFRMFPDSSVAKGAKAAKAGLSHDAMVMAMATAETMRGSHF